MPRRPRYQSKLDGILVVDKPVGMTSSKVVQTVRFAAGNCKTGHAGTLDPLASGVLVCCLGRATKLVGSLMADTKQYVTTVDLSATTATCDAEAEAEPVEVATPPSLEQLREACDAFKGEINQQPPSFSAIRIDGKRAYELARSGDEVEMPSRTVRIDSIEILDYRWPHVTLRITSGKGVYIRSLGRDLGASLGVGGYLVSLRRTKVGAYDEHSAWDIERVREGITQDDLIVPDDMI